MMTAPSTLPGLMARSLMGYSNCALFLRHEITHWNLEDRITTFTDVPLHDTGRGKLEQLSYSLAGASVDRAWSTPLSRGLETCTAALSRTIDAPEIVLDDRLVEPSAGVFEGLTFGELETGPHAAAFRDYVRESDPVMPEGAVHPDDAADGVMDLLDKAAALGGRTLIASHGALIRMVACRLMGTSAGCFRRVKINNGHGMLVVFYPQPPHQIAGLNLPPL